MQDTWAPATRAPVGQVIAPSFGSLTVTGSSVTLPVLVTRKSYLIVSPRSGPLPSPSTIEPAAFSRSIDGNSGVLVNVQMTVLPEVDGIEKVPELPVPWASVEPVDCRMHFQVVE